MNRDISPARQLVFGMQHSIPNWIPIAVQRLMATPELELSLEDCERLGVPTIQLLHETRTRIRTFRLAISFTPPRILHDSTACRKSHSCADAWALSWWGGFARHYLHPDSPCTHEEAISKLKTVYMPNVTVECQRLHL